MDSTVKRLTDCIKNIEDKNFNVFFVVIDSKGTPTGSLAYIYETAKELYDLGYKVKMLHAEKEDFEGVGSWLGEEYASLPHANFNDVTVAVSPDDFIFIPEIYSNVMSATKNFPCKRAVILQNFKYMTEVIPFGVSWDDLKIRDCITTSDSLKERLHKFFPEVSTKVVRPSIPAYFYETEQPKKLIINLVSKSETELNNIIKPFYWKHPEFSWVSLRPVGNVSRKDFADALRDSVATVWCDTSTDFGHSALEAMASGNIVIGKIPEHVPEWLRLEEGKENGLWFYDNEESQDAIAGIVQMFLTNTIPAELYESMQETVRMYSPKFMAEDVKSVYEEIFEERKKELEIVLSVYKKKNNEEENKTE